MEVPNIHGLCCLIYEIQPELSRWGCNTVSQPQGWHDGPKWSHCHSPTQENPTRTGKSKKMGPKFSFFGTSQAHKYFINKILVHNWVQLAKFPILSFNWSPKINNRSLLPRFLLSSPSHQKFWAPGGPSARIMGSPTAPVSPYFGWRHSGKTGWTRWSKGSY